MITNTTLGGPGYSNKQQHLCGYNSGPGNMPYTTTYVNGKKIVLDENGKPCRTCNSLQDLMMFAGSAGAPGSQASIGGATLSPATPQAGPVSSTSSTTEDAYARDPPDSQELGSSTWTFLHSLPSQYPERASLGEQKTMFSFLSLFGKVYPCPPCAADFRDYIEENPPQVEGRNELGQWLCEAHNEVNAKLGKPAFDCRTWRERWLDGWYKK